MVLISNIEELTLAPLLVPLVSHPASSRPCGVACTDGAALPTVIDQ